MAAVEAGPRLGVVCDFPEEGWPSMDLCAEMLLGQLGASAARLCPPFRRRFGRLPGLRNHSTAFNADRFLNRHYDYPRFLRGRTAGFDFFHIVDHSYAHLVLELPAARAGVYCHDLDTFRCLLGPQHEKRPAWFRRMARRKLDGLRQAAFVFYSTAAVRKQIETHGLIEPARLVYAPYGVCPEFTPDAQPNDANTIGEPPFLLHVGSCIERKRIDVLLETFAAVRSRHPSLRLVQVGGTWTVAQGEQIGRLDIGAAVEQQRGLPRSAVAALYRRAGLLLLPSEAEGFGLPLIEGLACGTVVVASDLPVLREVGGTAALYGPVGDVGRWTQIVLGVLEQTTPVPDRANRLAQASRYSWQKQAEIIAASYRRLAHG